MPKTQADLAQLVEQLFRKQQVVGSSPMVGSTETPAIAPKTGAPTSLSVPPFSAFTPIHTPNPFTTPNRAAARTRVFVVLTTNRRARGDESRAP
jgi:hypothetical protein